MKSSSKLAVVALVLVVLVLAFLLQRSGARGVPSPASAVERPLEGAGPLVLVESPLASADSIESSAPPVRVAEDPAPLPAAQSAACVVLGRVVDELHRPLSGVPVTLYGWKSWADGHDVARLPGEYDIRGWETPTDSTGAFRFAVPVPTVARTQLRIEPDPYHDSVWVIFGGDDADTRPPLHAGENDLGTFLLVATGAIRGSILSDAGRPLAEADARIADGPATTLGREARSDARGSYLIAHVKPGSYGVAVDCEGFLSAFRTPFQVEAGRITDGVDFALRPAPTLSGRVVDDEGSGIEGAELQGWPTTSGRGATGTTGADGFFELFLPKDEPYTLEVEREGYDSFGLDHSVRYAPGTADLRIALPRSASARTTFVVVDAETGASITRFGLEIERDRGSAARSSWTTSYRPEPEPELHPDGELEVFARPGLDLFTVQVPGYLRQTGDVRHASTEDTRQVVEMVPGGTLIGQVVDAGLPVAGADVRLQPLRSLRHETELAFRLDNDTAFQTATDREGHFRFDMLDAGSYHLVARGAEGRCAERVPIELPARGDLEFGAITLAPGATMLGQVLVPPGRSGAGLEVYLQPWQNDVKRVTDAAGRFRFDGLLPGTHELALAEAPGVLTRLSTAVTLAAGEVREVVLDARAHGTCDVTLTIQLGVRAAAGLAVVLRPEAEPDERHELGTTDAEGRVSGWAPARGRVRVEVSLPGGARLVHPDPLGPLEQDAAFDATVRFEVGSLVLELPRSLALPAEGWASLVLVPTGDAPARASRTLRLPADPASADLVLENRSIRCDNVAPGEYELTFAVTDAATPVERISQPGGVRIGQPPLYRSSAHASVRANEVTRVVLP